MARDVTVTTKGGKVRFRLHSDDARDFADCIDDYNLVGHDLIEVDAELGEALAVAMQEHGLEIG